MTKNPMTEAVYQSNKGVSMNKSGNSRGTARQALMLLGVAFAFGFGLAGGGLLFLSPGAPHGGDSSLSHFLPTVAAQSAGALGDGEFAFLANRKQIWAINKSEGRFAGYHFREDEERTIERTKVVTLDQKIFPPADTIYMLSDRNLTEVIWVCNKRTGDVQLWSPRIGGDVTSEKPLSTMQDLLPAK